MANSLVIEVISGADAPERCHQAFTVAAAACAAGVPVEVWLSGEAAWLAVPGRAAGLEAAGLEAAGLEAAGLEAAGLEAAGLEAAGLEAAGLEAAGLEAAGLEAAERGTPRPGPAAGVARLEPELGELLELVLELGRVKLCTQAAARRSIGPEDLIEGVTIAGAASYVERILREGTQTLNY